MPDIKRFAFGYAFLDINQHNFSCKIFMSYNIGNGGAYISGSDYSYFFHYWMNFKIDSEGTKIVNIQLNAYETGKNVSTQVFSPSIKSHKA